MLSNFVDDLQQRQAFKCDNVQSRLPCNGHKTHVPVLEPPGHHPKLEQAPDAYYGNYCGVPKLPTGAILLQLGELARLTPILYHVMVIGVLSNEIGLMLYDY